MSGGGLLNFGFVRADKTTSREEIEALKIARSVQEAIDLERIKVQRDKSEEASRRIVVRGKKVSTSKEAMRKRIERRRNKLRATMSDDFAAASRAISSLSTSKRNVLRKLSQLTTMTTSSKENLSTSTNKSESESKGERE